MHGRTGAYKTSWGEANPRDLLKKLRDRHPDADLEEICELFVEAMQKPVNNKYHKGCFEYFATNAFVALERETRQSSRPASKPQPTPSPAAKAARREAAEAVVEEVITKRVRIVLSDMVAPNGKPLRECTGTDVGTFHGWYGRLKTLVGPTQKVGDVLPESVLWQHYEAQ